MVISFTIFIGIITLDLDPRPFKPRRSFFQDLDLLAGVRPFSTENVFQGSYTRKRACAPATSQPENFFQLVSVRAEKVFPDEKGRSTYTHARVRSCY